MTWVRLDEPPPTTGVFDWAGDGGFGHLVVYRSTASDGPRPTRWAVATKAGLRGSGRIATWDDDWGDVVGLARGLRWHVPGRGLSEQDLEPICEEARRQPRRRYVVTLEVDGATVAKREHRTQAPKEMRLNLMSQALGEMAREMRVERDGDEIVLRLRRMQDGHRYR